MKSQSFDDKIDFKAQQQNRFIRSHFGLFEKVSRFQELIRPSRLPIMLSAFRNASYMVSPTIRRKGYPIFQPVLARTFARGSSRDPRDKEPIIVEIIDNTDAHKEKMKAENRTYVRPEENKYKPSSFSVFNFVQNTAKSVVNRVSNTFFPDEETRAKNEIKKKINAQIDASFQGGGILGSIMKGVAKTISGQVVSNLVDLEKVKQKLGYDVEDVLSRDPTTKRLLGLPVELSEILELQSVQVENGRRRQALKQITMQVTGSHSSGIVRAIIDNDGREWTVQKVMVTVERTNQTYEAELTPKPDKDHIIDV